MQLSTNNSTYFKTYKALKKLVGQFQKFRQSIIKTFFSSELQVRQVVSDNNVWWYAYNPQTGNSVYADSETELMIWIEENYQGK